MLLKNNKKVDGEFYLNISEEPKISLTFYITGFLDHSEFFLGWRSLHGLFPHAAVPQYLLMRPLRGRQFSAAISTQQFSKLKYMLRVAQYVIIL
jgi:hypothetical protein